MEVRSQTIPERNDNQETILLLKAQREMYAMVKRRNVVETYSVQPMSLLDLFA